MNNNDGITTWVVRDDSELDYNGDVYFFDFDYYRSEETPLESLIEAREEMEEVIGRGRWTAVLDGLIEDRIEAGETVDN